MGKDNEAIGYLDKALSLDPKDADALNGKGVVLAKLGNYYEAIKYFDKALTIKPDFALALKNKQKILELVK